MTLALIFWILMLIWLGLSLLSYWPNSPATPPWIGTAFLFLLILILGWGVFGPPVRG